MPSRKRLFSRLFLEALEDRLNPAPTLITNVSLPGAYPQQGVYSPAPVVADLDGDGKQEVLATGGNTLYAFKLDPSSGQMFIDHTYSQGNITGPLNSTPVVVNLPTGPAVFLGDGKGTVFGWDARTGNLLSGWPQTVAYYNAALPVPGEVFAANQIYGAIAAGDLDGDGVPEIVVTSVNHEVTAFHANGQVMWRFNNDDTIFDGVAIGDLNGDGLPEVVVGGDSSSSAVYWDGGRINCLSWDGKREWVKRTDQVIWSTPVMADLFGDGKMEVIVGTGLNYPAPIPGHAPYPGNAVYVLSPDGNDLPGWPYVTANSSTDARTNSTPAIADLNGDGKLDIVIADASGTLRAINSSAQTIWAVQATTQVDFGGSPIIADVNNDGQPDVVFEVPEGRIKAFDGATGQVVWNYADALGHVTEAAVGHFRGDSSWQLAEIAQSFNTQANTLNTPSNLLIFDLGNSPLTPPWGQFRRDAMGNSVVRPDSYTQTYVTALYQGTLGRAPSADEMASALVAFRNAPTLRAPTLQILDSQAVRQAQLGNIYQTYLGRQIDPSGLAYWTGVLNGGQSFSFIQTYLTSSAEGFNLAGGTNSAWVTFLYRTVLGRAPGNSELTYWTNQLNANATNRFLIAQGIVRSAEATNNEVRQWFASYAPGGVTAPSAEQLEAMGWDLRRGRPEDAVITDMMVSKGDYVSTQREGSWVRALYADVLQRAATSGDVAYWLSTMEAGNSAGAIASGIVKSSEYHRLQVRAWIGKLLHRNASQSDLNYFGGLLDQGVGWAAVQQMFISSDEYFFGRAGGNVGTFINTVFFDEVGHGADSSQISFWVGQPNVRALLPQVLLSSQEYYLWTIGGDTFTSWFGTFLRRFGSTQPDNSRLYPIGTQPSSQGLANAWVAGARPDDLLVLVLSSAEYIQIARDRAFWAGARWLA
jgi:hypothetical protein